MCHDQRGYIMKNYAGRSDKDNEILTELREAGIDSVDDTTGKGGDSDADFLEKWGKGDEPYTEENLKRANKLTYEE